MKNARLSWKIVLALLVGSTAVLLLNGYFEERALHAIPAGFKKFSLADPIPPCGRWKENMPSQRALEPYSLYIGARKVWRSKIGWELTREEMTQILANVSTAADMGDWGARALLAHFYLYGLGSHKSNHVLDAAPDKAIELQQMAAKAGQPWGLYDLGVAYEHGYGGLPQDAELAWAYYLRAAQLGSPEAQMALASAYREVGRREDERSMQKCAFEQGHGPAAYSLGKNARVNNRFKEAIDYYQQGVKLGCADCAAALELLFMRGHWYKSSDDEIDRLKELHIMRDPERERRYSVIYDSLKINPDLRLSRLDAILPLPPSELPEWSGLENAIEPEMNRAPEY